MKQIPLSNKHTKRSNYGKYYAIVDDDDYDYLIKFNWSVLRNGNVFYAIGRYNGKAIKMHRLITKAEIGVMIDHIDGNGLNNQKNNLRFCNNSQNQANRPKRIISSSKYVGVSWDKKKEIWKACIKKNGVSFHLGYFNDEISAAKAYNIKTKELNGEFARLNII